MDHCHQCIVLRSPTKSSSVCNQIKATWIAVIRCPFAAWQCKAPHCPYNSCNNHRPAFWVSSSSTILTRPSPKRFPYVWTTQRSNGRKEVPFWWRGTPRGALVVAQTTKRIFFQRNLCTCKHWRTCIEHGGDYVEKWYSFVPLLHNK